MVQWGATIVTAKADLTIKGYIQNPHIALPPKKKMDILM